MSGDKTRLDQSVYDSFAWIYNKYWGTYSIKFLLEIVDKLVLQQLPNAANIIDVCCGTGQFARALTEKGYRVIGIDLSSSMIKYARENAPLAKFTVADARNFKLTESYDAAISTFDSFNHIMTISELKAVFRNVNLALKPDGIFLFDLNMEEGYWARCQGSYAIVQDDHVVAVRSRYEPDERKGLVEATIFRTSNNQWQRQDLTVTERCHSEQEVRCSLEETGFSELRTYDSKRDFGLPQVGRMFFFCHKHSSR